MYAGITSQKNKIYKFMSDKNKITRIVKQYGPAQL